MVRVLFPQVMSSSRLMCKSKRENKMAGGSMAYKSVCDLTKRANSLKSSLVKLFIYFEIYSLHSYWFHIV